MPEAAPGTPPVRCRLILEAKPSDVPPHVRLKLALKILLRTCEFWCIDAVDLTTNEVVHGSTSSDDRSPEQH